MKILSWILGLATGCSIFLTAGLYGERHFLVEEIKALKDDAEIAQRACRSELSKCVKAKKPNVGGIAQ